MVINLNNTLSTSVETSRFSLYSAALNWDRIIALKLARTWASQLVWTSKKLCDVPKDMLQEHDRTNPRIQPPDTRITVAIYLDVNVLERTRDVFISLV